jgi:hypothetical protein
VEVNVAKPGYQKKKPVCLDQLSNVFLEAEVLNDLPGAG